MKSRKGAQNSPAFFGNFRDQSRMVGSAFCDFDI